MSIPTRGIDAIIEHIKLSIHTSGPARVISYNESKQEADIELLFMQVDKDGKASKYPMIPAVPVLGMRYKIVEAYPAEIGNVKHEGVPSDGSAATIKPKKEIMYKPFLKPDDVVWVSFAERALDNLQKKPFNPEFRRMFDVRDAVITGIFGI